MKPTKKYYHSFYAEIADVIERFFFDVGILERPDAHPVEDNGVTEKVVITKDIFFDSILFFIFYY